MQRKEIETAKKSLEEKIRRVSQEERPIGIQIFGADPAGMAEAASCRRCLSSTRPHRKVAPEPAGLTGVGAPRTLRPRLNIVMCTEMFRRFRVLAREMRPT